MMSFLVVIGPGQKILARVWLGQFFVAGVRLGQPSVVWVWKISPQIPNPKFFNFSPLGQKKSHRLGQKVAGSKTVWPLIYCGSKVGSGQVIMLCEYNSEYEQCQFYFWEAFTPFVFINPLHLIPNWSLYDNSDMQM